MATAIIIATPVPIVYISYGGIGAAGVGVGVAGGTSCTPMAVSAYEDQ